MPQSDVARTGLWMYVWSSLIESVDQPGKVANPARGQLNRENEMSLSSFVPVNLVSREGLGRPVPRQPVPSPHSDRIWSLLTGFRPLSTAAASMYLSILPAAAVLVPSLLDHTIAYRWRSLPRDRRHTASSPKGSSSNRCCLFRYHHGPINNVRLLFPTPSFGM